MTPILDSTLSVRVTEKMQTAFHRRASRYGKPSDTLRELIQAYLDGRLTVTPPTRKDIFK